MISKYSNSYEWKFTDHLCLKGWGEENSSLQSVSAVIRPTLLHAMTIDSLWTVTRHNQCMCRRHFSVAMETSTCRSRYVLDGASKLTVKCLTANSEDFSGDLYIPSVIYSDIDVLGDRKHCHQKKQTAICCPDWLIDWLIFVRARNERTCSEENNSDNESDS